MTANLTNLAAAQITTPDFGSVFSGVDLGGQLDAIVNGWQGFFDTLDAAIKNQVFISKLPVVGDQLGTAIRFVGDLRDRVLDNFTKVGSKTVGFIRQQLFEALVLGD